MIGGLFFSAFGALTQRVTNVIDRLDSFATATISFIHGSPLWPLPWLRQGYRWRRLLLTALTGFAALTAMGRLDSVLTRMHPVGGPAGGVMAIAKPLSDATEVLALLQSWRDWHAATGDTAPGLIAATGLARPSPTVIANWWLALDSLVFAPALAYLLASYAWRRRRYLNLDPPIVFGWRGLIGLGCLGAGAVWFERVGCGRGRGDRQVPGCSVVRSGSRRWGPDRFGRSAGGGL